MIKDNMDFIDADKPEYAGGPTDHLEQRHLGKQAIAFVQTHHRPMTNAELRENRKSAINSVEEIGVLNVDFAYAKWLTTILKTYMKHNINNLSV